MGAAAVLGRFLGKAHDKLWHMTSSGELCVAQSRIAELGADEVSIEVDGECHPILTCSRLTSQRSGLCDEFGLTGSVCSHGQPLLGMFLAMPAPERFLYYDLALQELLLEARVNVMYLDTGCSYSRHLQLHSPEAAAPGHIRVPWWHARGHGVNCCLRNSGLYLPGRLCAAASAYIVAMSCGLCCCMQGALMLMRAWWTAWSRFRLQYSECTATAFLAVKLRNMQYTCCNKTLALLMLATEHVKHYSAGAGRRVGETCEQLWAQLKPLTSITRYMAKPNYQDCIDDFLGFVAAARLEEFVPFMVGQHKSLVRKLGK